MNLSDYIINEGTLAITPYGKRSSLIYDVKGEYVVNKNPNKLMELNCLRNGSSYKGRLCSTELLTGISYKAPVMVIESDNIVFFPTSSPRLKTCLWINNNNINGVNYDEDKNVCIINFSNDFNLEVDMSLNVINNQIYKASRLESISRKNKRKM